MGEAQSKAGVQSPSYSHLRKESSNGQNPTHHRKESSNGSPSNHGHERSPSNNLHPNDFHKGHRRRISDMESESRANRIKEIVAASKTPSGTDSKHMTLRQKRLELQQKELELTEELEEEEDQKRRSQIAKLEAELKKDISNESALHPKKTPSQSDLENLESSSSSNSSFLIHSNASVCDPNDGNMESPRSGANELDIRELEPGKPMRVSKERSSTKAYSNLKSKVYSFTESESDFVPDAIYHTPTSPTNSEGSSSSKPTSPRSGITGTYVETLESPSDDSPQAPVKQKSTSTDSYLQNSSQTSPIFPSKPPLPPQQHNQTTQPEPIVDGYTLEEIDLPDEPISPRSNNSPSSSVPIMHKSRSQSETLPSSPTGVQLHRKGRLSESNSISRTSMESILNNSGYATNSSQIMSSNASFRSNSGSSLRSSSFGRQSQSGNHQRTSSISSSSSMKPNQTRDSDDDEDSMVIEVLNNLKQLNDEEKIHAALFLGDRNPSVLRDMRDHLRKAMKEKQNQRIVQYTQSPNEINWNARFQTLMEDLAKGESSKEHMETYSALAQLAQDFIYCAKTYGKLIISEVYAPFEEKTIKPISVGGALGGLKYVCKNILFKFAVDQYGLFQSDEYAAKVAGHDLKGLIQYFNLQVPGLHFPLMALVDYAGFRLQALSLLPINAETLIYGTSDGGRTVHADNPKFNAKMRLAGEKLNLKSHQVGLTKNHSKLLYSCADIEGHHGFDGRYYAIDFSRSFPPIDPDKVTKNAHLFRLFRPEFVKKYPVPLCPDTFSGFVANYRADEHNKQIREATDYLYKKIIPDFATELNAMNEEELEALSIKHALHKKGINLSLMGVLRQQLKEDSIFSRRLLIEMIARTTYHIINEKMRAKAKELRIPTQQPYKVVITERLNLLFGKSKRTYDYWNVDMKRQVGRSFPFALTYKESSDTGNMKVELDGTPLICELYRRVSKIVRFQFTPKLQRDFCENPQSFNSPAPFDDNDMEELVEGIKHTNIVSLSMGFYSLNKASSKVGDESVRMLLFAKEKFQEALDTNPEDKSALRELAQIESLLGNPIQADRHYVEAIQADATDSVSLFKYAEFLDKHDMGNADDYYLKSLEIDPYDEVCLRTYADYLRKNGILDEADKFYELARRQSKVSSIKEEEVYENKRRTVLGTEYAADNLLPSDHRGPWSTKEGTPRFMKDVKLPSNWEWIEEWVVDKKRHGVDEDGWEYSLTWNSTWVASSGNLTYVARRRWKRVRRSCLLYLGEDEEVESIAVEDVISQMKDSSNGLVIKDRYWYMKTYPQCFVGSECVQFFMNTYSLTRKQAIKLGNKMLTQKVISHVENQHLFSDAQLYYHFIADKDSSAKRSKKFDTVKKEGYLEKQGAFVKSWKKRYFVLRKGSLYYYSKAEQLIPRGIISLVQATVVSANTLKNQQASPSNIVASAFVVQTGRRNFMIKAKDPTEKEEWMLAIQKNCI